MYAPGNYICIYSHGEFHVGECYLEDDRIRFRGTKYMTDGTTEEYDP